MEELMCRRPEVNNLTDKTGIAVVDSAAEVLKLTHWFVDCLCACARMSISDYNWWYSPKTKRVLNGQLYWDCHLAIETCTGPDQLASLQQKLLQTQDATERCIRALYESKEALCQVSDDPETTIETLDENIEDLRRGYLRLTTALSNIF